MLRSGELPGSSAVLYALTPKAIVCSASMRLAGELPEGSVVLGASASGATVYAEPAPAVALNNAEARLSGAEAAEEAAILRRLTRAVLQHSARLRQVCYKAGY